MRRKAIGMVLAATATTAVLLASGPARASWTIRSAAGTATVKATRIPVMRAPRAEISGGSPTISWTGIPSGPADQYVVIRSNGDTRITACTVTADTTTCRDSGATPGSTVTYSVHATIGGHWAGADSDPGNVVTV